MQDVLKKILSMDKAATEMIERNNDELSKMESDISDVLEKSKYEAEDKAIEEGKALYNSYVDKAKEEALELSGKALLQCDIIEKQFMSVKDSLISDIFDRIISLSASKGM